MSFGFLFATIGYTLLNSICELLISVTELIKANINEKIVHHNVIINELTGEECHTRAIGFATTCEEEDDDSEY